MADTVDMAGAGSSPRKLVDLRVHACHPATRAFLSIFGHALESILSLRDVNDAYARFTAANRPDTFFRLALDTVNVRYDLCDKDFDAIPRQGPLVIVANHPFGGIEGIILGDIVSRARPDTKILGNYLLEHVPEMRPWLISVDPFDNKASTSTNATALKEILRWLKDGGALVTFPAGEVSHLTLRRHRVTDSPWTLSTTRRPRPRTPRR